MKNVTRMIQVPISRDRAFHKFVNQLNEWWPKEYTWSQEDLVEIKIDPQQGGLCTEIGPYGFRCDWGRVTEIVQSQKVALKWQISPQRVPEPNPDKASVIIIDFKEITDSETSLEFVHADFENHGDGAEDYIKAMGSKQGWDYILTRYLEFCKK